MVGNDLSVRFKSLLQDSLLASEKNLTERANVDSLTLRVYSLLDEMREDIKRKYQLVKEECEIIFGEVKKAFEGVSDVNVNVEGGEIRFTMPSGTVHKIYLRCYGTSLILLVSYDNSFKIIHERIGNILPKIVGDIDLGHIFEVSPGGKIIERREEIKKFESKTVINLMELVIQEIGWRIPLDRNIKKLKNL